MKMPCLEKMKDLVKKLREKLKKFLLLIHFGLDLMKIISTTHKIMKIW